MKGWGDVVRGSPPVLSGLRDAGRAPMSQGARERQEHCHPHLLEKSTLVNSVFLALGNLAPTSDTTWAKRWTQGTGQLQPRGGSCLVRMPLCG